MDLAEAVEAEMADPMSPILRADGERKRVTPVSARVYVVLYIISVSSSRFLFLHLRHELTTTSFTFLVKSLIPLPSPSS